MEVKKNDIIRMMNDYAKEAFEAGIEYRIWEEIGCDEEDTPPPDWKKWRRENPPSHLIDKISNLDS